MTEILIDGDNPGAARLRTLGDITYLYTRSTLHPNVTLTNFRTLVQPPLDLDQVVVFRDGDRPWASITWAFFSEEAEARFIAGEPIQPSDWRSGKRMWVVEMVSLFGNRSGAKAARWFLKSIPDHVAQVSWMRLDPSTDSNRFVRLHREDGRWKWAGTASA